MSSKSKQFHASRKYVNFDNRTPRANTLIANSTRKMIKKINLKWHLVKLKHDFGIVFVVFVLLK